MTAPVSLDGLVAKWREDAQRIARSNDDATAAVAGTLIACADELAAFLAANGGLA